MNYFSSDFKLGILGGGQLGKMLLYDTRKFDIQTYVVGSMLKHSLQFGATKFFSRIIKRLPNRDGFRKSGRCFNH